MIIVRTHAKICEMQPKEKKSLINKYSFEYIYLEFRLKLVFNNNLKETLKSMI